MCGIVIDDKVMELLNKASVGELTANVRSVICERENFDDKRTDMEILHDELDYLLDMYSTKDCRQHEEYADAKKLLKDTNNGRVFSLDIVTFKPKISMREVEQAREIVEEYERLKKLKKELR